MKDYYKVLGVSKEASEDEIKRAYRRLAHRYHPDKGGDAERFKEVSEAYRVLSDREKRSQYDRFGQTFEGGFPGAEPGAGGFRWAWGGPGGFADEEEGPGFGFEFQDLGDLFEDFFGGGVQGKNIRKGKDIEVGIEIPLEATLTGFQEEIPLEKFIICTRCQGGGAEPGSKVKECFSCRGTGEVQQIRKTIFGSFTKMGMCPECRGEGLKPEKLCNVCGGEGRIKNQEKFRITIPPGVDTNQTLRFEGQGDVGKKKGKTGDLFVKIYVKAHPIFKRKGDDVYATVLVPFSHTALGSEVEVPTLEGTKISLQVPAGTESGKIFRIVGKGIPHFSGWRRGHMYVEVKIETPKKLTKQQKELLERLRQEGI